ncbi:MAG: peptidylprolyl isomerase, partial [Bacteroidota bacterium]
MKKRIYLFCLTMLFVTTGCGDDQSVIDDEIIAEFITENNIDAIRTDSGLYYEISQEGTGGNPSSLNSVEVRYTGKF